MNERARARANRAALVVEAEDSSRIAQALEAQAQVAPVEAGTKPKSTRGGARQGAGRKPVGADVKAVSVTLPAATIEGLKRLGGGNLSAGIRQMYRLMSGAAR